MTQSDVHSASRVDSSLHTTPFDAISPDHIDSMAAAKVRAPFVKAAEPAPRWSILTAPLSLILAGIFALSRFEVWKLVHSVFAYWMVKPPVDYYFKGLDDPASGAMREYPVPVMWLTQILKLLTETWRSVDPVDMAMIMLVVVDAVFALWLIATKRWWGSLFWSAFGLAIGPLLWGRWDIVPAVLVAWAMVAMSRRPALSGFLLAWAATIKLWPAVIGSCLLGALTSKKTWIRVISFAATTALIILLSIWSFGFDRITSVFDYQEVRGLQIESIPATIPMWDWHTGNKELYVIFAPSQSFEIFGPGVSTWISVSRVLTIAMLAFCVYICLTAFIGARGLAALLPRSRAQLKRYRLTSLAENSDNGWTSARALWLTLIIIGAVLISNKVMSTQYIIWWGAPFAVCLDTVTGSPAATSKKSKWSLRFIALLVVAIAGLSQWMFPFAYDALIAVPEAPRFLSVIIRNILILITFGLLVLAFYREPAVRLLRTRDLPSVLLRLPWTSESTRKKAPHNSSRHTATPEQTSSQNAG